MYTNDVVIFYIDLESLCTKVKVKVNFAPNCELPSFCKQVLEGVTAFLCHKTVPCIMFVRWQQFLNNYFITRTRSHSVPLGIDHALEHINRIMKVTGGLVGIIQIAST